MSFMQLYWMIYIMCQNTSQHSIWYVWALLELWNLICGCTVLLHTAPHIHSGYWMAKVVVDSILMIATMIMRGSGSWVCLCMLRFVFLFYTHVTVYSTIRIHIIMLVVIVLLGP